MTTVHIEKEMQLPVFKNAKRRRRISTTAIFQIDEVKKLSFPTPVVNYNTHMRGSDGNAQQRAYYSPRRSDRRY